jgi:phytoene dehydrogenase-like protein
VRGGGPALVAALESAAREAGVDLRTSCAVERLIHDGGAVRGVVLAGGEEIEAPVVGASCDPRRVFLEFLPPGAVPHRLAAALAAFRCRGAMAQVLLALDRPLEFRCAPGERIAFARAAEGLDAVERAFDAIKYRRASPEPVLDVHVPTVDTPGLAPAGHDVVSLLVHCAPFDLDGGWDGAAAERLADASVAVLERHSPGLKRAIAGRAVLTPADLASRHALPGGHVFHGEHALDQLAVRPAPGCAGYTTPIAGLYLCGSGSHPGGGLTCAPGALAARVVPD